ncbi:Phosphoesterase PA-phosphatase, partial [Dysosmobacter welbionis]
LLPGGRLGQQSVVALAQNLFHFHLKHLLYHSYFVAHAGEIYPFSMYLLAEDPPLGLQMVQMGQGLSHGKELLRQGKIRPVPAADAPTHPACDLIGGEARRLLHGPQGVLQPAGVVGLQLRRPLPQVPGLRPVGGIQLRCVQSGRPVQTAEIVPQRVLHSLPAADVGRDVKQHMVAAEQPPAGRVIQAQVPRRVARRQHAPQHTAAVMERRAVLQLRIEPFPPGRGRRLGRI